MKTLATTVALLSPLALAAPAAAQSMINATVVDVLNGDTLLVNINNSLRPVNLAYIRPPSGGPDWGLDAQNFLQDALPSGTPIQLDVSWISPSGTIYAYVHGQNGMLNIQLLEQGLSAMYLQSPDPVIRSWYEEAQSLAQANGTGPIWGDTSPTLVGSIAGAARPLGVATIGAIAVVSAIVLAKTVIKRWKQSTHVSLGKLQKQLDKMNQALVGALANQKQLERQYELAQENAANWLERAEVALRSENQDLAREALVRKKTFVQEAEIVKQSLDEATNHVSELRSTIGQLETQITTAKTQPST